MHFTFQNLVTLAIASLAAAAPAAQANITAAGAVEPNVSGGFFNSGCSENTLYYTTIHSKCQGTWISLDLNAYITNDNGQLRWGGSDYGHTCAHNAKGGGSCNLQYSILGCDCKNMDGRAVWATVELNQHLAFIDGKLVVN
ncbi:hypothetical protein QBC44DRAFT_305622 [Cladorrhinum sp. PSN332]|nr:hypothetical protein QBC44DRAFT_305622 [Cladorrhinum sp. PSN332]